MKKKKKILFGLAAITLILSIGFVLSVEKKHDSKMQSKHNDQIAVYIQDAEGNYQVNNTDTFPKEGYVLNTEKSTCQNGSTLTQDETTKKIRLKVSQSEACTLYFDKEVFSVPKAVNSILNDKPVAGVNPGNPFFVDAATTDEGVYEMADDYGTSYYYRGAVENNYVQFANKFWRIVRVNGDGSIRMIYDGEQAYANGVSDEGRVALTGVAFNTNNNDAKYVGYMYGPEGETASTTYAQATTNTESSNIKTQVDNWYKTNIVDAGFSKYVSDEIFCNDRSVPGKEATGWSSDTGLGYGMNETAYGTIARYGNFETEEFASPTFKCPQKNDAFTVSDTSKGNGALTYPVGLITIDEIVAAGAGKFPVSNSSYYLYKGLRYRSISPYLYSYNIDIGSRAYVFNVGSSGGFDISEINLDYQDTITGDIVVMCAVAPVINLSPEYSATLKGTGTMTDPYTIS